MKPISSEISGLLSRVQGGANSIGPQHGERGVATVEDARRWLEARKPTQVDQELKTSLQSSLGVTLETRREWRFPEGKPAYSIPTMTGVQAQSRENIGRAIQRVETAMTPVSRRTAETMIAQLSAATAIRSETGAMGEIKLDLYVDCLLRHPADIATAVVRAIATEPREGGGTAWFPTLAEIEGACRQLTNERLSMLNGLRSWSPPDPRQVEIESLHEKWVRLNETARSLNLKVGPGPATDTGERGEKIKMADEAHSLADSAKREWINAVRAKEKT